jgi:hypothetical protein
MEKITNVVILLFEVNEFKNKNPFSNGQRLKNGLKNIYYPLN